MRTYVLFLFLLFFQLPSWGQTSFPYRVELQPVSIPGMPGLHSYAFGQDAGRWLLVGGRLDGLHARQPFNSFPAAANNDSLFVIDPQSQSYWSASLSSLPSALAEQLQATNFNFHQVGDTLYVMGGYAYSATAADHLTFPQLSTLLVPQLIDAIVQGQPIAPYIKQQSDSRYAISGGQLASLNDTLYLVGGHRFDGRYNPMGHATYTQTYSDGIRKFVIDNSGAQPILQSYQTIQDPVHLHRRDYNLLPQIFPDGSKGFTISSGVFQVNIDLPFLYPVDIKATGHQAVTGFNQYLSNYHSAKVAMYDSLHNTSHNLFFGGMSQYYYENGQLMQDNNVPFVKTISRLSRYPDGSLEEFALPSSMPALKGASAEFIPNHDLPMDEELELLLMHRWQSDTVRIGHIFGGIYSPSRNPFSNNNTSVTAADASLYQVLLIKEPLTATEALPGKHSFGFQVYPNPSREAVQVALQLPEAGLLSYFVTDAQGRLLQSGEWECYEAGEALQQLQLPSLLTPQTLQLTIVLNGKFSHSLRLLRQ